MKKLADFWTVEAAAAETGLKYKTLLQRIARGKVQCEHMGGRMKLIPSSEVLRLKKERGQ